MKQGKNKEKWALRHGFWAAAAWCCLVMLFSIPALAETAGDGDCAPNPDMALDYKVMTNPDPLAVGDNTASITITAANPNPGTPVTINAITIEIQPGSDAADLTAQPGGITPVAPGTDWTIDKSDAADGIFIFKAPGGGVQVAGEGLTFTLSGIAVNDQPGPTPLNIWEYTPAQPDGRSTCISVGKFPANFKVNYFYAEPATIDYGAGTTIFWSCTEEDSATYTLEYEGNTRDLEKAVGSLGIDNLNYEGAVVFNLVVRYLGMVYRKQTTVTIQRPRIVDFEGPSGAVCFGQKVELSWATEDTDHCQLYIGANVIADNAPANSSGYIVFPTKTTTYTLYACDKGGNHKDNRDFTINYGHWQPGTETSDTIVVGQKPQGIAVSPDGTRVYVTNTGDNSLSVIDTATNKVIDTVKVGRTPWAVAVNPGGKQIYVTNNGDNTVSVIDTTQNPMRVTCVVTIDKELPWGIAASTDGKRVYVACSDVDNSNTGTVSVLDVTQNPVVVKSSVTTWAPPWGLATSPDGKRLYGTVNISSVGMFIVMELDTQTPTSWETERYPFYSPVVSPDGNRVYVTNRDNGRISVIDASTKNVIKGVAVGNGPWGIAIDPLGKLLFTANSGEGTVSVIDTAQMSVSFKVAVGKGPRGVAVAPGGSCIYTADFDGNTVSVIECRCLPDSSAKKQN